MPKLLAAFFCILASSACAGFGDRAPTACDVLTVDDIAKALKTTGVTRAEGSGFDSATGIDTCRWTADGAANVELRVYRADSSAEGAWTMVFESARVHATKPGSPGRTLSGVGDDAMVLAGQGDRVSVAFRVGRTGAVIAGTAAEDALIELAKRAARRL